jgi:hypothetical protein
MNYCPGTDDPDCAHRVDQPYPDMLSMFIDEFIVLGNYHRVPDNELLS